MPLDKKLQQQLLQNELAALKVLEEERLRRLEKEQKRRADEKTAYDNPLNWTRYHEVQYDHRQIEFDKRKALIKPYSDTTRKEVIGAAAQTGKTVYELIFLFWFIKKFSPAKAGFYFPTDSGVKKLVQDRFNPFAEDLYKKISNAPKKNKDEISNTELKQYGDSSIYFFWYEGKITTESTPLDAIVCDEIRRTNMAKLEEVQKRLLASENGAFERYASTFGFPDDAIDYMFKLGDQQQFNTRCPHCNYDFVMWRHFQDGSCILQRKGSEEYYYACPKCGREIFDTNEGTWVAENKMKGDGSSYQLHGMLAKSILRNPTSLWVGYKNTKNVKEYLNSNVGIPFLDTDKQLITREVLDNCVAKDLNWDSNGSMCYVGVDVQMEFLAVVVKKMLENGKTKICYMTYFYGTGKEPFQELSKLMHAFDINIAVLDGESPRAAEVREFCKEWKGRVFFCTYHQNDNLILWHDRVQKKTEEKTIRDVQQLDKYHVSIQKDLFLEFSLKRFVNRENVIPHTAKLAHRVKIRDIPYKERLNTSGKGFDDFVPVAFCLDIFYPHMQQYVKEEFEETVKIDSGNSGIKVDAKTGNKKYRFVTKAIDPHLADANMFCDAALARRYFRLSE